MKKILKKIFKKYVFVAAILLIFLISNWVVSTAAEEKSSSLPFRALTADQLREEMGAGWNLGNTMDGHTGLTPNEKVWQNTTTTKALIKSVHDLGFNTVRIPVTWGTMIDDANGYTIRETWISRVQDIVDYCIAQDMYVIINIHHDGAEQTGWLRVSTDDKDALYKKFGGVWENIAKRFKEYDEHLIFEDMNEVKGSGTTTKEDTQVIMKLNQIFVDKVRGTGSNNAKRWLVVTGKYNFIDSVTNTSYGFELPIDTIEKRLIVSIHDYTPWSFCGAENLLTTIYTLENLQRNNTDELKKMYDTYTSKGIPVIVGEYGANNKDNAAERAYYLEGMNRIFQQFKLTGIYWDQGWYDRSEKPDYSFSIIDRGTGKPIDKVVTDAIIRGCFIEGNVNCEDIKKNTNVVRISDISLEQASLTMTIGDMTKIKTMVTPKETNEVVLWKTTDSTVATVAYGNIRARGIGSTTITAYSQSGSIEKQIKVTVTAMQTSKPCTEIVTAKKEYVLSVGDYVYLDPAIVPNDTDSFVAYQSSNENVATVSSIGKLLITGEGKAVITIKASSGLKKEITVKASGVLAKNEISLALNVYYNDTTNNYFSNEVSKKVLKINKNGKYKLTFDCSKDLSDAAVAAGVKSLSNLTAIYIKDYSVSTGKTAKSPLKACNIKYNKIVVDGKELTITNKKVKSALKSGSIFDSNDPINGWEGSAVDGVNSGNHICNFTGIKSPKKIEVTFTISGMVFEDGTKAKNK